MTPRIVSNILHDDGRVFSGLDEIDRDESEWEEAEWDRWTDEVNSDPFYPDEEE